MRSAKEFRYSLIAREVYIARSVSRMGLSHRLGWKLPTVTRLTTELRDRGILTELRASTEGKPGHPSTDLSITPGYCLTLGLEFGPDQLRWAVTDAAGGIIASQEVAAPDFEPGQGTVDLVVKVIHASLEAAGIDYAQFASIGIGLHAYVNAKGDWLPQGPLGSTDIFSTVEHFTKAFGRPVIVEDIARMFALAEHRLGSGADAADALYLLVGPSGFGAGIVSNNALLAPSLGFGGEVGHVTATIGNAPKCSCGNYGCLRTLASGFAIAERAAALSGLPDLRDRDAYAKYPLPDLCRAAANSDPFAQKVLMQGVEFIAFALANTINVTGTPHVVIGGDFINAGEDVLRQLEAQLKARTIPALAPHISVQYSSLPTAPGPVGAALRALDSYWAAPSINL